MFKIKVSQIVIFLSALFLLIQCRSLPEKMQLDSFGSNLEWQTITSDETVKIQTEIITENQKKYLKLDYNFTAGSGFCGIQKEIPINLPENFQFSFMLKGNSPLNNFEFKLLDKSGENVWWRNQRNYKFPKDWQKVTIKKRQIEFAWGPAQDKNLKHIDKIQFFIASATGGKGTIYLDDFKFEHLAVPDTSAPNPKASATSQQGTNIPANLFDNNKVTKWQNDGTDLQPEIIIDLQKDYEYGGLLIDWDTLAYAMQYQVLTSSDLQEWYLVYDVNKSKGRRAYLPIKDAQSRYLKLKLLKSAQPNHFIINEIQVMGYQFAGSPENVYRQMTKDAARGLYPRYFNNEQCYWTVCGVNNDRDEALINEDGMVEVDKNCFSIEPFVFIDDKLNNWNDVKSQQSLAKEYLPLPSVKWEINQLHLKTTVFADGKAGRSSLYLKYTLSNNSPVSKKGNLYLAIRPFQVNPPWQFLNWPGGTTPIDSIILKDDKIKVGADKSIFQVTVADGFGATTFDAGDISEYLAENKIPEQNEAHCKQGFASAALCYNFELQPNQSKNIWLAVPFHQDADVVASAHEAAKRERAVEKFWQQKFNTVTFNLPQSANHLINTVRSNLAYILINRDGFGIQPGSRSYERSWIRDGSLTSSALLKLGVRQEVKDFIEWYAEYQYADGKVPCVVDLRGPDPTDENDSNGQLIFALMQYYLFTGDKAFLEKHFVNVQNSIVYMNRLRASRKTNVYKNGNSVEQACYGLLPESISHEGYSAKPMHSYWDDFFALKGYKDAVKIANILGRKEDAQKFSEAVDSFKTDLYHSINKTIENNKIDYIPGCVELGDFDATSTAVSIYPCNELQNLPQPYAQQTFDRYFKYFQQRANNEIEWKDYTPYEVRLIGTFIHLGQKERAHALIDFFFKDQRPPAWNHWAEVVRKGYRTPGFIGDMPHTWVGSDFISAFRSMFVYEDELNESLVVGAGLYTDWIDAEEGMSVSNLPTYYGDLSYSIQKVNKGYKVHLKGEVNLPAGSLELRLWKDATPRFVQINGKKTEDFTAEKIVIKEFPATLWIEY